MCLLLLAACANHEGTYEPACIAYEGDRIELRAGRFEWQRFTDQRTVDSDGNLVEPFPEYPKIGAYSMDTERLELVSSDGVRLAEWYLVKHAGEHYLLSSEQHEAFLDAHELPGCPLRLTRAGT
ncbi:MAG: hypothetical protein OEM64_03450 [Gammaproteobacteria bacterium]|nr:hypothetical protein [Gammaproteobacteria bacterium]